MVQPKIFAHRGGVHWAPENTMAGFHKCLALGIDGFELDAQQCASGEWIVCHDKDLLRTTGSAGVVYATSYSELSFFSAAYGFNGEFKTEKIPLLSEVLSLFGGCLTINIEIKCYESWSSKHADNFIQTIKTSGITKSTSKNIVVSSFSCSALLDIKQRAPEIELALITAQNSPPPANIWKENLIKYWHPAFTTIVQHEVDYAHQLGLIVNAWTINDHLQCRKAIDMGLDGIITDDPVTLKAYLQDNGTRIT